MKPPTVLTIPAFRNLFVGQAISQLGDAFYYITFMFMVQKVTGSSTMVGVVGACETVPFLLFGAYAGVLADRIDRKRIMLASDLLSGAALTLFTLTILALGKPPVWLLLVVPFVLSSVRCFFMPAKSAAIPGIVPPELVLKANALSASTQNAAPTLGLALCAGVLTLLYALSPVWCYASAVALNAASFFGSALFIAKMPPVKPDRVDTHQSHPLEDFRQGLRYISGRRDLKLLTLMLAIFRLMVAPFYVVYLAANDLWLGGKLQTVAWLEFSFSIGMVIGSIAMGRVKASRPLYWLSAGLLTCGLTVVAMAFSPHFWLIALWNFLAGLSIPAADIPAVTYLQLSVPDHFRGRVNAVRDMVATGVMPVGLCLGGLFIARFGVVAGFLTMGIGMVAGCLVGLLDRQFRNVRMPNPDSGDRIIPNHANLPAMDVYHK